MSVNSEILSEAQNPKGETKDLAKYFIAEFQRQSKNADKTVNDEEAVKILKSFKKDIEGKKDYYDLSEYNRMINFLDKFLPSEPNENDIRNVLDSIDFTQLRNKKQAVGIVKKHFEGNVDGKLVSNIIENEY